MVCHNLGISSKTEELHLAWKELQWNCGCLRGCYQSKIVTFMKNAQRVILFKKLEHTASFMPRFFYLLQLRKRGQIWWTVLSDFWNWGWKYQAFCLCVSLFLNWRRVMAGSFGRWCCCSGRMAYSKSSWNIILVDINSLIATLIKSLNKLETRFHSSRCLHMSIQVVLTL